MPCCIRLETKAWLADEFSTVLFECQIKDISNPASQWFLQAGVALNSCFKTTGFVDQNKHLSLETGVSTKFTYQNQEMLRNVKQWPITWLSLSWASDLTHADGRTSQRVKYSEQHLKHLSRTRMEIYWCPCARHYNALHTFDLQVQFVHLMSHLFVSELWHWFFS